MAFSGDFIRNIDSCCLVVVPVTIKSTRSLSSNFKRDAKSSTWSDFDCCTRPGYFSIIAMGALISIIITTIVVYTAFKGVDPNYSKVLQTFGATRWQIFREVILPASFPTIISTLKVNVGLSWVGL